MYPAEDLSALRRASHTEIASELLELDGARILDIGCGPGSLTRFFAGRTEHACGLDPDAAAIGKARDLAASEGLRVEFRVGVTEAIPFEDGALDIVVFSNSLHHVSLDGIGPGLRECARVLAAGGVLYVMEPVPRGGFFEVQRLFNDETEIRTAAFEALGGLGALGFGERREVFYRLARRFADFDAFRSARVARNPKHGTTFEKRGAEIEAAFVAAAHRIEGDFVFDVPYRVDLFRKE
jgi:hypothetical protein